jgi:chorismate mutase
MTAPTPDEVERLRAEIDRVNAALVGALQQRARLCRLIAQQKRQLGWPMVDAARESAMLEAMLHRGAADADGFPTAALKRIVRAVLAESRALVESVGRG